MGESYETEKGGRKEGQAMAGLRWATLRGIPFRKRQMVVARLGGKRPVRLVAWGRMLRKIRLRWLKLKCIAMLKKMKKCYTSLMKDVMEAGAYAHDSYRHKVFLETSFAIPIWALSRSTYPTLPASS